MKQSRFIISILAFGYAFLYIPLVSVIFYSFNDSRLATVWGGFSTRWYGELFRNDQILDAACGLQRPQQRSRPFSARWRESYSCASAASGAGHCSRG